jgi:cellulose synthase/poly-beta-1,6-N-acetylglucosamine synthase-like glycosyltransferase/peptidoglycan/xylan/chitin deacetylase (PgdA/CDA1 family)
MATSVFHDPERRRWKHLRPVLDVTSVSLTLLVGFFFFTLLRQESLPALILPEQKRVYHALKEKERRRPVVKRAPNRRTGAAPSQVTLNSGEGIRAGFYVQWDAASFASLREYYPQIDLLFPEWLHVLSADGHLQGVDAKNKLFPVLANGSVRPVDDKVMPFLKSENAELEVFPLVNNFDPIRDVWMAEVGGMFTRPGRRAVFRGEVASLLSSDRYRGLTLDFEGFPFSAQPGYRALVAELASDLHARGMKLYVALPAHNMDFDYAYVAGHADGVILMDYDQHYPDGPPGPVAAQSWFTDNVISALKAMPREKIILAVGNYGYEWASDPKHPERTARAKTVPVQEAWLTARESEARPALDPDSLNPHYAYVDEAGARRDVWFLDGVTALNQMRAAQALGINTFALWRLGSEDRSLWAVWDVPGAAAAEQKLLSVPPGADVDMEGRGEILRIEALPNIGERSVTLDPSSLLVTAETFSVLPGPYRVMQYGWKQKQLAISFDDGPDPGYTPKILDILKAEQVPATFFLIGAQAERYSGLTQRIYGEGHQIGNHTFWHPDITNISRSYMKVELNFTERFFASELGVKPLFFRAPYSIDQDPETGDEVRPLEMVQDLGYITVGSKLDPNDWQKDPRPTAEEITAAVMTRLTDTSQPGCSAEPCGNIVLLHDGGGNRSETVRALPMIIHELRDRGYTLVAVSALLDKTSAEVMPQLSPNERWAARLDSFGFLLYRLFQQALIFIFFVGDTLMTLRLLMVGALAIVDRFRAQAPAAPGFAPAVAILVPAFNEEMVIERTVRAALASEYPQLRVIVIDDGSSDATLAVARRAFAREIEAGRVLVLTQENAGKAEALSRGLAQVREEIFLGIDADTVISPTAVARLVTHFTDPSVSAVAGNTRVGNRVNLWTRWQALEYITSQNFERRALDVLNAVSVVPGAIGAWRTSGVRAAGGFHVDTVAEDADLTMSLLERGDKVNYDDRALAYTEAPTSAGALMRQRFRWSFGILQAVWKHRGAFARKGTLGWVALPNIIIFQILLPLTAPFIDLMFLVAGLAYLVDRFYFHPDSADPANFLRLAVFFAVFLAVDFLASLLAFALERQEAASKRDFWLLAHVWLQRLAYRQLFSVVLFKTLKRAVDGREFSWDKLERTAATLSHGRPA